MRKIFFSLIIIMTVMLCSCSNVRPEVSNEHSSNEVVTINADYPYYSTAGEIADKADIVFSGKVREKSDENLDVRAQKSDSEPEIGDFISMPYTVYEISINKVYKGKSDDDNAIKIKVMGGNLGDVEYQVEDSPKIEIGKEYLFLVKTYDNMYASLLNMTQSVYPMDYEEEKEQPFSKEDILRLFD